MRTSNFRKAVLLIFLAAISHPALAATVFSDSQFNDSDWSAQIVHDSTAGTTTVIDDASQALTGGNPDSYRSTTITFSASGAGSQQYHVVHLHHSATHDPSADGPIASIDFSIDGRRVSQSGGTPGVFHHFTILQGGKFFVAFIDPVSQLTSTWRTQADSLVASDFGECCLSPNGFEFSSNPDFSATGGPIQFGYSEGTGAGSAATVTTTTGTDNWSVTVNLVPEPSSLLLWSSAGLCWVLVRTRRARPAAFPR